MTKLVATLAAVFAFSAFGPSAIADEWNQGQGTDRYQAEGKPKKKRKGNKGQRKKREKKKKQWSTYQDGVQGDPV